MYPKTRLMVRFEQYNASPDSPSDSYKILASSNGESMQSFILVLVCAPSFALSAREVNIWVAQCCEMTETPKK